MGMPLFVDYYSVHDMEEGRIGMAPHVDSDKRGLQKAEQPINLLDGNTRAIEELEL